MTRGGSEEDLGHCPCSCGVGCSVPSFAALQKGCGYHLDLFMVAVLLGVCSLMGLPWFVAATVLSITHVNSLKVECEGSAPGEQVTFQGVREQRVTGLMVFVLMGCSVFLTQALQVRGQCKAPHKQQRFGTHTNPSHPLQPRGAAEQRRRCSQTWALGLCWEPAWALLSSPLALTWVHSRQASKAECLNSWGASRAAAACWGFRQLWAVPAAQSGDAASATELTDHCLLLSSSSPCLCFTASSSTWVCHRCKASRYRLLSNLQQAFSLLLHLPRSKAKAGVLAKLSESKRPKGVVRGKQWWGTAGA